MTAARTRSIVGALVGAFILLLAALWVPEGASAANGVFIAAPGRTDIVFDDARRVLYVTSGSQVLRYNVDSREFLAPWDVPGSVLLGIDLSPDGKTLAVADAVHTNTNVFLHLIHTGTGVTTSVAFTRSAQEDGLFTVAYCADGRILSTSRLSGTGWTPLRRYDPESGSATTLMTVAQDARLASSYDRQFIGWAEPDLTTGPFGWYRVLDGALLRMSGYGTGTEGSNDGLALNADGSRLMVHAAQGNFVHNRSLGRLRVFEDYALGAAFHPRSNIAMLANPASNQLHAVDVDTGVRVGSSQSPFMFDSLAIEGFRPGRMKISRDGSLAFTTVAAGVWYTPTEFAESPAGMPGTPLIASPAAQPLGPDTAVASVRRIELAPGDTLEATLVMTGGVDADLAVYPPTKWNLSDAVAPVLTAAEGASGETESLAYTAPVSATYYVVSTLVAGSGETTLTWTVTPGRQAEPDDDIPGVDLPVPLIAGAVDSSGDVWDVFRATLGRGASLIATATPQNTLDVEAMVFADSSSHVVFYEPQVRAEAGGPGAAETLSFTAQKSGEYYLAIKAQSGAGSYSLETSLVSGPAVPTSLTLEAQKVGNLWVRLNGRLVDDEGNPFPGIHGISVQQSFDGVEWSTVDTVSPDPGGAFTTLRSVARNTLFRATYPGLAGAYEPATSTVAAVEVAPGIDWLVTPPTQARPTQAIRVSVRVRPPHAPSSCTGTWHFDRLEDDRWVTRKSSPATGTPDPLNGDTVFTSAVTLPTAGAWRVTFIADADDVHGASVSAEQYVQVGKTSLSISPATATVRVGDSVTISGTLRDQVSRLGLPNRYIQVESSPNGTAWSRVATVKTGAGGVFRYSAAPRAMRYFRFSYVGEVRWQPSVSAAKLVRTYYAMSGNTGGHFLTRKIWMSTGNRAMRVTVTGSNQTAWIHTQDESERLRLTYGPGEYSGYVSIQSPGFCHFSVSGDGWWYIRVYN